MGFEGLWDISLACVFLSPHLDTENENKDREDEMLNEELENTGGRKDYRGKTADRCKSTYIRHNSAEVGELFTY